MAKQANPDLNLVNAYGPTENGTISTAYLIDRDFEQGIPIGAPINNSTAYILDADDNLQPIGVSGELNVGGDGVARGYMNNPELTAQKFFFLKGKKVPDKKISKSFWRSRNLFSKRFLAAGGIKTYKTGDLVRWLPGGVIEFQGRKDYQVKIRGHRIELGEIENRLLKHPDVTDAIVLLTGGAGQPVLSSYFTAGREIPAPELRNYLGEALPDYMVPTYFVQMEAFPVTPSGKIDRGALPDPKTMVKAGEDRQPPGNETEAAILQVWAEVLDLDPETISIEDNFFELGGNSINVLKVQKQLNQQFERDISMSSMFISPTIKLLADEIMTESPQRKLEYVVKLNNSTGKKNIFIFHPMHGMTFPYKELAVLLEDRFNVYGVQAKGLTTDAPLPETPGEMAGNYLDEIRSVQPNGPYILSGYCIGNALAYEAARQLEDQGQQVETLILLDVNKFLPERPTTSQVLRIIPEQVLFLLHLQYQKTVPENIDEEASEEQKKLMKRVKLHHSKIFSTFKYKRIIDSPIMHIRARKNLSLFLFQCSWRKMSRGDVKLFKSTGNHHNMLTHPHVDKLAEIIKANID
jgi:thioesterase domain-containing protein/aryl carrier-like protein